MNLKHDYTELYQHWLREFEEADLTCLSQEDFNAYKKLLVDISALQVDKADNLKYRLTESYKRNLEFLFNDLLKIRELKIINAALANREINLEYVIETEKLLYQNLISTFKGYTKVKSLFLNEEPRPMEQEIKVDESSETPVLDETLDLEEFQPEEELKSKKKKIKETESNYNYTLIRFLKKADALVGIDLINYGPFEKNDIANLPYKNAVILVNEKYAEKIEVS